MGGAFNAVRISGDAAGDVTLVGAGAGSLPTASAVVADLIDLAVGRAQKTFLAANGWSADGKEVVKPGASVRSRFYLRAMVEDRPGMLASVAGVLAGRKIGVASIVQHEVPEGREGEVVPMVIMTHYAEAGAFRRAVAEIASLPGVASAGASYPVDD